MLSLAKSENEGGYSSRRGAGLRQFGSSELEALMLRALISGAFSRVWGAIRSGDPSLGSHGHRV